MITKKKLLSVSLEIGRQPSSGERAEVEHRVFGRRPLVQEAPETPATRGPLLLAAFIAILLGSLVCVLLFLRWMLRPDAHVIRRSISRRDTDSDAEVFTISLDPYLDRQTGYSFSINSGGVALEHIR